MKQLFLHPSAEADLSAIRDYISQDNSTAAQRVTSTVLRAIAQLCVFPRVGRHGQVAGTYELVLRQLPYIVVYRILAQRIEVIAIVHMARSGPQKTIK